MCIHLSLCIYIYIYITAKNAGSGDAGTSLRLGQNTQIPKICLSSYTPFMHRQIPYILKVPAYHDDHAPCKTKNILHHPKHLTNNMLGSSPPSSPVPTLFADQA